MDNCVCCSTSLNDVSIGVVFNNAVGNGVVIGFREVDAMNRVICDGAVGDDVVIVLGGNRVDAGVGVVRDGAVGDGVSYGVLKFNSVTVVVEGAIGDEVV